MKRGVIEVQFNWIFILIVGIMILLFFIGLTNWYKGNEEKKIASKVMTDVQNIIVAASTNSNTASKITVPDILMRFYCDADECSDVGCTSSFEFEGTGVYRDLALDIIFSPDIIESEIVNAWALEWNTPYKVSNFLYFSNPQISYYLVYDDNNDPAHQAALDRARNLANEVKNKMDENVHVNTELVKKSQIGTVKYNNEYLVRFVFFQPIGTLSLDSTIKDSGKYDAIFVTGDSDKGNVKFSKKSGTTLEPDDTKKYQYIGVESLIGAVFSETYENYKCNMRKALLRLKTVNQIYKQKTLDLALLYSGTDVCRFFYDDADPHFDSIDLAIADAISTGDFTDDKLDDLALAMDGIKEANDNADIKSCQKIY